MPYHMIRSKLCNLYSDSELTVKSRAIKWFVVLNRHNEYLGHNLKKSFHLSKNFQGANCNTLEFWWRIGHLILYIYTSGYAFRFFQGGGRNFVLRAISLRRVVVPSLKIFKGLPHEKIPSRITIWLARSFVTYTYILLLYNKEDI